MSGFGEKLTPTKKYLIYGISTTVAALLGYIVYRRFIKSHRSGSSSSSDNEHERSMDLQVAPLNATSSQKKSSQQQQNFKGDNLIRSNSNAQSSSRIGQRRHKGRAKKSAGDNHQDDAKEGDDLTCNGRKIIYFDSNDEMFCADEVQSDDVNGEDKNKTYTKVMLRATEEERIRLREMISKQKKRNIQQFLQDVNEKKGTFIHQKKRNFKEDIVREINMNGPLQQQDKSQGSRTTSTQSEENHNLGPQNTQKVNRMHQEQFVKQHQKQMANIMNAGKGQVNDPSLQNGGSGQNMMELSPNDFNTKDRYRWFDYFQMYTNNFIQDEEKNEKFRKRQQLEKYYSGINSSKKRSASME